jgi:quinol monooxygenase YgiN
MVLYIVRSSPEKVSKYNIKYLCAEIAQHNFMDNSFIVFWENTLQRHRIIQLISACIFAFMSISQASAQQNNWKVRIARIEVDPAYLKEYRAALQEHAYTAVREEPGVLALNAVYDKEQPTRVTVFEIYASDSAYKAHLQAPHFLKYKSTTKNMVKSLELVDVTPIALATKHGYQ